MKFCMAVWPDIGLVFTHFEGIAPGMAEFWASTGAIWRDVLLAEALVDLMDDLFQLSAVCSGAFFVHNSQIILFNQAINQSYTYRYIDGESCSLATYGDICKLQSIIFVQLLLFVLSVYSASFVIVGFIFTIHVSCMPVKLKRDDELDVVVVILLFL